MSYLFFLLYSFNKIMHVQNWAGVLGFPVPHPNAQWGACGL